MYGKIGSYTNAYHAIWYNERKVNEGLAHRLYAGNFLEDAEQLNLRNITRRFSRLEDLNQRSNVKAYHISLSFSHTERLSNDNYTTIGKEYMSLMGLSTQPYVIYLHMDTGYPHLHFVVSLIDPSGRRIKFERKPAIISLNSIELIIDKYQLVKSGRSQMPKVLIPTSEEPCKLDYGHSSSTKAITEVLSYVLPNFKYTDINELNSILMLYNVYADIGRLSSITNKNKGLVYQIHDDDGKFKGGRVPAYRLPSKPGLTWLEKVFVENHLKRHDDLDRIRTYVTLAVKAQYKSWVHLLKNLRSERIHLIPFMSSQGLVHELVFVDFQTKTAVTGVNLGLEFTARAIFEKIGLSQQFNIPEKKRRYRIERPEDPRLTPSDFNRARQHLVLPEQKIEMPQLRIRHSIKR